MLCFITVAVVIISGSAIQAEHLIGEHVCQLEEKYTVTVIKQFHKNVTIREYVWCMSVPPRCSKYRTNERTYVKPVEEERFRLVDKCCDGYTEDANKTFCIPVCGECIHGTCSAPETCNCFSGFMGTSCNNSCPTGRWGSNCTQQCTCAGHAASCDPRTGNCHCQNGFTGARCEVPPEDISTNSVNCTDEKCKFPAAKSVTETEVNTKEISSPENSSDTQTPEQKPEASSSPSPPPESSSPAPFPQMEISSKPAGAEVENITSEQHPVVTTPVVPPAEKSKKNFDGTGKTRQSSGENYEQWLKIEDSGSGDSDKNPILVFGISATVGLMIIIVLVAVMSILIARYKQKRDLILKNSKSCESPDNNNKNRLSTQPIIQRSAFHAPLPDPPVFQNPVFSLADDRNSFSNRVYYTNYQEPPNQCQYDIPPSSGSYRAASIPEPGFEPLYDEIPANQRPVAPTSVSDCPTCCYDSVKDGAPCSWQEKT